MIGADRERIYYREEDSHFFQLGYETFWYKTHTLNLQGQFSRNPHVLTVFGRVSGLCVSVPLESYLTVSWCIIELSHSFVVHDRERKII
jgi:hypothetical protein